MAKTVSVGIVGMGIGRTNGKAFAASSRARVVALCDVVQERMDSFAAELPKPVKTYSSYKDLCRDGEVDAVFVGTPNQLHVPVALEAVRRGKHVLITKPLADSLPAARRLVSAAEAAGVVNMMSLSTRFGPACRYLASQVEKGALGEIYYARARSIRRSGIPDWSLGFITAGGGAFRDMGVHVLDAAWSLLGMPTPVSVSAVSGAKFGPKGKGYWDFHTPPRKLYRHYDCDDYAGGFIRFEGGLGLQVESFWASHQPVEEAQVELFGTEAGAGLDPLVIRRTVDGAPQDIAVNLPKGKSSWQAIADHFVDCILDGQPCKAPLRHGLIVQEMLEAVLASARKGREVRLAARGK